MAFLSPVIRSGSSQPRPFLIQTLGKFDQNALLSVIFLPLYHTSFCFFRSSMDGGGFFTYSAKKNTVEAKFQHRLKWMTSILGGGGISPTPLLLKSGENIFDAELDLRTITTEECKGIRYKFLKCFYGEVSSRQNQKRREYSDFVKSHLIFILLEI